MAKPKGFGKILVGDSHNAPSALVQDDTINAQSPDRSMENVASALPNESVFANMEVDKMALSPEERTKQILRVKYGMKTLEEQQLDAVQLARREEEKQKWAELKKKAEMGEEFDLLAILPTPVIIGIDRFLKAGTAICGVIFVASGILIAIEAWSKASGDPLSPELDDFIVQIVEPNFTPGLFVLLSFSVSLGLFASLQLGSQSASYREK
jgi:hypothetical protein